jgi:hypothetical protein
MWGQWHDLKNIFAKKFEKNRQKKLFCIIILLLMTKITTYWYSITLIFQDKRQLFRLKLVETAQNSDINIVITLLTCHRPSKFGAISAAFVIDVANAALSYGVIWYDRYGHDMKRTLMNRVTKCFCAKNRPTSSPNHSLPLTFFSEKIAPCFGLFM